MQIMLLIVIVSVPTMLCIRPYLLHTQMTKELNAKKDSTPSELEIMLLKKEHREDEDDHYQEDEDPIIKAERKRNA